MAVGIIVEAFEESADADALAEYVAALTPGPVDEDWLDGVRSQLERSSPYELVALRVTDLDAHAAGADQAKAAGFAQLPGDPPPLVFVDEFPNTGELVLLDGWHRLAAAQLNGHEVIDAWVSADWAAAHDAGT